MNDSVLDRRQFLLSKGLSNNEIEAAFSLSGTTNDVSLNALFMKYPLLI